MPQPRHRPAFLLGLKDSGRELSDQALAEYDAGTIDGVLISASACWRRDRGFRPPARRFDPEPWQAHLAQLRGLEAAKQTLPEVMPCALDSAGFTAMAIRGGYPWEIEEYLELAASEPWAWYAQPDLCCEQEIARDRVEVLDRIARSAGSLGKCLRLIDAWRAQGVIMPDPMPVLQGRRPDDYLYSLELIWRVLELYGRPMPTLLGLGSVCGRLPTGEEGLSAVLSFLDARLPGGIQLHLFGLHSDALGMLGASPRWASFDSQAYQKTSRREAINERKAKAAALGIPLEQLRPGHPEWVADDNARKGRAMSTFINTQEKKRPQQVGLFDAT